jgi:hypothetical protein
MPVTSLFRRIRDDYFGGAMSQNFKFVVVLSALVFFLVGGILLGRQHSPALAPESYASCSLSMRQIYQSGLGDVYNYEDVEVFEEPSSYYLAFYDVVGDEVRNPDFSPAPDDVQDEYKDTAVQQEAWQVFTQLIPAQDRQMVVEFNVFTDGYSNTLAAVDRSKQDISMWVLEVDVADLEDKNSLVFTIIHEYAHLLTLDSSQVIPDAELASDPENLALLTEKADLCPDYFTGMGCSYPDSYINMFYKRFWVDIDDEWEKVDMLQYNTEDDVPYYNALYNFYKAHQDQFVGDYAVTHPTEDIAESFTHFIFNPKPTGNSIREQKILFFYEYPNLVRLREDILNGACNLK